MGRFWWTLLMVLLVSAGLYLGLAPAPVPQVTEQPLLWPQAGGRSAVVQALELRRGEQPLVRIERTAAGWVLPALGGYPARQSEVEALLQALLAARLQEPRTALAENHARLGLAEQGAGAALRLRLLGAGLPERTLLVGDLSASGGQLVRWLGEDQVWRVDRSLQADAAELAWADRRMLEIPFAAIREIQVQLDDGRRLQVAHSEPLADLAGSGLGPQAANGMATLFARLQAADLLPTSQLGFSGEPWLRLQLSTFAGGQVQAAIYRRGEHFWLLPGAAQGMEGMLFWPAGWAFRLEAAQVALLTPGR